MLSIAEPIEHQKVRVGRESKLTLRDFRFVRLYLFRRLSCGLSRHVQISGGKEPKSVRNTRIGSCLRHRQVALCTRAVVFLGRRHCTSYITNCGTKALDCMLDAQTATAGD